MLDFTSLPYKLNTEAKLYCVVIRNIDTDEVSFAVEKEVTTEWLKTTLADATEIILHNGIKFDLIALKLFGVLDYEVGYLDREDKLFGKPVKIVDTLVRSRLLNPDRYGGHGLKAWGVALGEHKGDYTDFSHYNEEMLEYCKQDTKVTALIYKTLADEYNSYEGWWKAEKLENKLADLAVKRETYGFWFNRDLAIKCVEDLAIKMTDLENKVNPILPPKPMNKTTLKKFTPPAIQFKKDRSFSANFLKFVEKHNGVLSEDYVEFYGKTYSLPVEQPIKLFEDADISDLDHVKMHLISLGWRPTEWKVRDLTKDTKKQSLTYEKRVETLDRWLNQTFDENKYKDLRLEELSLGWDKDALRRKLVSQLSDDKPVRVPTSPCVRVGVEKELCPNLVKLGSKVDFANDFTLYLTYKHRKSSIAGGDLEDVDYEDEYPNTGFLSMYRTVDGRIPTPAIEIGASCVPASTRLLTWDGYKKIVDVKIGDKVLTHEGTYQVVTDRIDNGVKPTFKVTLSNGMTLTCTANHPFYTTEGWVRCEDLVADNVYVYGEKELWKDAVGFDGYKVSSWGSVVGKRGFEVKPLTSNISGRPCGIDIYTAPYNKTRKGIGRLVCEAFNGGDSNLEVRHLDGNSWNNNAENLVFGTSAENSTDWKLHGSCGLVAKVVRKLTDEDVSEIKRLVSLDGKREAHGRVAKTFNVSREHVRDICSGKKRSEILNTTTKFVQSFKTVKVISVEYVCDQPTFDITVEDAHSYVAEGIVVHNTNRYRHIGVCNVARASSIYGKEMRSLFGCGEGMYQFGFDFSSLEARIQGHYILPFNGEELAEQLLASKPNDIHCYSEDTEILTPSGWKTFGGLKKGEKVAQYENGLITFVEPLDVVWQPYEGLMYEDPTTKFKVTPNHRVFYKAFKSGKEHIVRADEFKASSDKRYIVGGYKQGSSLNLSKPFIQLLVAVQADGHFNRDSSAITFTFVKQRKIDRLKDLLDQLRMTYKTSTYSRKGREEVVIRVVAEDANLLRPYLTETKDFKQILLNLPQQDLEVLVDEVQHWDGTVRGNGDVVFDTTSKSACEFIQTVCALVGKKTNYNTYEKVTSYGYCKLHRCYISNNTKPVKSANKTLEVSDYKGFIGCVSVPSGLVFVKREGEIVVSGNTLNANKLGISRDQAKSISYALMYGASYKKLKSMLGLSDSEAKALYDAYWEAVKPLSDLREEVGKVWKRRGSKFVVGIDGRKINTRSQHSLLNALFQSGGVINAKYTTVFLFEWLEDRGYKCDPFVYQDLDCCGMIEYHDECQLAVKPELVELKKFETEEDYKKFLSSWNGKQLGSETTLRSGKICIAMPSVISEAVQYGIDQAEKHTNLKVALGFEYVVANNWYNCH